MKKVKFKYLPLNKIDIKIFNVRVMNNDKNVDNLANNIKKIGVQQPIVVFKEDGRYKLLIGIRRFIACKRLGLKTIPAVITTVKSEADAILKSLSENIHHVELENLDKMTAVIELINKLGSVDKVAEYLGVSAQTVRSYLGYNAVPESIKKMIDNGDLSVFLAVKIVKNISDEKRAIEVAKLVSEKSCNENKRKIVDIAIENPNKSLKDIIKIVRKSKFEKITISLTPKIASVLKRRSQKYSIDIEDIVMETLREWFNKNVE